jgi:hypothetical protein
MTGFIVRAFGIAVLTCALAILLVIFAFGLDLHVPLFGLEFEMRSPWILGSFLLVGAAGFWSIIHPRKPRQ